MDWVLGATDETTTAAGGHQPSGVQHAVMPGKQDISRLGRPLAPCGTDVIAWATPWSLRVGTMPICQTCEDITRAHPDPSTA